MTPKLLALAFVLIVSVVAIWDIMNAFNGSARHSVSAILQDWSFKWPALPLLIGFIMGHLFWPIGR